MDSESPDLDETTEGERKDQPVALPHRQVVEEGAARWASGGGALGGPKRALLWPLMAEAHAA